MTEAKAAEANKLDEMESDMTPSTKKRKKARKHRKYDWVKSREGYANVELPPQEVAEKYGVREDVVLSYIKQEIEDEAAVVSLPFQLILILLYALMNSAHEVPTAVRSAEMAIEFDLEENANFAFSGWDYMGHKNYEDVNSFADFWSWMNRGFMPLTYIYDYPTSENHPNGDGTYARTPFDLGQKDPAHKEKYLWHNRRIGAVRLIQEVTAPIDCLNEDMANKYNLTCYGQNHLDLTLPPTEFHVSQTKVVEEKSKTVFLTGWDEAVKRQLRGLEETRWLNEETYLIQVSFLHYNAPKDLLIMSSVNFLFPATGHIWKEITHRTMNLRPYQSWTTYLWDIMFYGHITTILIIEIKEVIACLMHHNFNVKNFAREYFSFWNIVDWVSVIMAYVILVLWLFRVSDTREIENMLLDVKGYLPCESGNIPIDDCYKKLSDLYDLVDERGLSIRNANVLTAFYPAIILLRLFKAFSAQPRLGVVTRTLYMAANDLAHFSIVMGAVFFTFTIMGVAFFGTEFDRFSTFERATMGLFRLLMGDTDSIEEMDKAGRPFAAFFFMSFMMTVLLIMLNMLIAIILDVYSEAKNNAKSSPSFFVSVYDQARRWLQNLQKVRVPLQWVVAAYEKHLESEGVDLETWPPQDGRGCKVIRASDFQAIVDSTITEVNSKFEGMRDKESQRVMRDRQAKRLVTNAACMWDVQHPVPVDLPEVLEQVAAVSRQVDLIEEEVFGPELPVVNDWEGPTTESLATLPLKDLIKAARLSLDKAQGIVPGSEEALRLGLQSAEHMVADLQCSAHV